MEIANRGLALLLNQAQGKQPISQLPRCIISLLKGSFNCRIRLGSRKKEVSLGKHQHPARTALFLTLCLTLSEPGLVKLSRFLSAL